MVAVLKRDGEDIRRPTRRAPLWKSQGKASPVDDDAVGQAQRMRPAHAGVAQHLALAQCRERQGRTVQCTQVEPLEPSLAHQVQRTVAHLEPFHPGEGYGAGVGAEDVEHQDAMLRRVHVQPVVQFLHLHGLGGEADELVDAAGGRHRPQLRVHADQLTLALVEEPEVVLHAGAGQHHLRETAARQVDHAALQAEGVVQHGQLTLFGAEEQGLQAVERIEDGDAAEGLHAVAQPALPARVEQGELVAA
ncbi:MAG: hypothetical protein IPM68_17240 [Flavobacteriales bacterium]|nr:hypothetical protein [Flavobacteriales bacterium]